MTGPPRTRDRWNGLPSRPGSRLGAAPTSVLEADEAGPAAVISRRASDRLRAGHLWVYRSDVEALIPALGMEAIASGALVTVLDGRRIPLGSAMYSDRSELMLRKISDAPRVMRGEYLENMAERVRAAVLLRTPMLRTGETTAARLLFAEADSLPGIIADRYGGQIVLQLLTQATAQDDVRELLSRELLAEGVRSIVERPDPRIRELENLPQPPKEPLFLATGDRGPATTFLLNGLELQYDADSGQKTGAFLDQRLNYQAAARHAHGRALDVCTYQGGFALHLARVCDSVTGVDASRAALEVAERNLERNRPQLKAEVDWIEADAFALLRDMDGRGERFDTIVLDPPAFAKSKRAAEGAIRGYKELNLRALRMLRPGGTLVTCSCSHHVPLPEFTAVVASAAADAGRHVRLLETRGASTDHPEVLTLPETIYLKCLIIAVD